MLPSSTSNIQPVFAFIGIAFNAGIVGDLTREFLELKRRFFPGIHKSAHYLDDILVEIKGADIRRNIATGNRRSSRAAFGFLDNLFTLIEKHDGRIIGRIWIKGIGKLFKGRSVYTFSMQDSCSTFQKYLEFVDDQGFIIADSRNKRANTNVSHSIFTRKFQANGDNFSSLVEMPTFGHSDNHAGIQIADLICSAVVFPMAIQSYCQGYISNVHTRDYSQLKSRYRSRLQDLQFRYQNPADNRWRGGIIASDAIAQRSGRALFQ